MPNATSPWRSRIVRHDVVDPKTLLPHPANWRLHSAAQQAALGGVLDDPGDVRRLARVPLSRGDRRGVSGPRPVTAGRWSNRFTMPSWSSSAAPPSLWRRTEERSRHRIGFELEYPDGSTYAVHSARRALWPEWLQSQLAGLLDAEADPDATPSVGETIIEFFPGHSVEPILPIEFTAKMTGEHRFHLTVDGERAHHAVLRVAER